MKLTFEQIRENTTGALKVENTPEGIIFRRFTEEQTEMYRGIKDYFYGEALCPAGVKIRFITDSTTLFIKFFAESVVYEKYITMDIDKNGEPLGSIDNYTARKDEVKLPFDSSLRGGEFSGEFSLGEGEKEICIYLPYTAPIKLLELSLDDRAKIRSVPERKNYLALGDSITMGFQALHPRARYAAALSERLGYTEYNRGIGGEVFRPGFASMDNGIEPQLITVAYGTNDWSYLTEEDFRKNCQGFFGNLRRKYPDTKMFVITPIWRSDNESSSWEFSKVPQIIKDVCGEFSDIQVIDGMALVPHDTKYFLDGRLHPNDEGFEYFIENLYKELKEKI